MDTCEGLRTEQKAAEAAVAVTTRQGSILEKIDTVSAEIIVVKHQKRGDFFFNEMNKY